MNAIEKYDRRADEANSLLCVGLDSDISMLPDRFTDLPQPQLAFNRHIIELNRRRSRGIQVQYGILRGEWRGRLAAAG